MSYDSTKRACCQEKYIVGGLLVRTDWQVVGRARVTQRYKQAANKSWSLTDCTSFQVVEAERIQAVLTHDQHLAQAEFESLLR